MRKSPAQSARGLDKIVFANLQNLGADQSRIAYPADDAEREDQFIKTGAEEATSAIASSSPGNARNTLNR